MKPLQGMAEPPVVSEYHFYARADIFIFNTGLLLFFYMPGHDPFIIVKDDSRNKLELGFVSDLFVIYFKKEKKCRVLTKLDSISVSYFHKIG